MKSFGRATYILWLTGLLVFAACVAIPNDIIDYDLSNDSIDCSVDEGLCTSATTAIAERRAQPPAPSYRAKQVDQSKTAIRPLSTKRGPAVRVLTASLTVLCSFRK